MDLQAVRVGSSDGGGREQMKPSIALLEGLIADPEVQAWIKKMGPFPPVMRRKG